MIEVAHAILEQHADVMDFSDLVNQIKIILASLIVKFVTN